MTSMKQKLAFLLVHIFILSSEAYGQELASDSSDSKMKITVYDDGVLCPGKCDAHAVLHAKDNGTRFAFDPATTSSFPKPCRIGELCRVCFSGSEKDCISVVYRGSGPPRGNIDVTPKFLEEFCVTSVSAPSLQKFCADLGRKFQKQNSGINCISNPLHKGCAEVIADAKKKRDMDQINYQACLSDKNFNQRMRENGTPGQQRSLKCGYEANGLGTGINSNGEKWRKLLPAACSPDRFVGKDGLDCCGTNDLANIAFGSRECAGFYVRP